VIQFSDTLIFKRPRTVLLRGILYSLEGHHEGHEGHEEDKKREGIRQAENKLMKGCDA
jgi:hypothetical protein